MDTMLTVQAIEEILTVVLSGAAVIALLYGVGRYIVRLVRRRYVGFWERLIGIMDKVDRMDAELKANSGGSLKDQVGRIDTRTRSLAARQTALTAALDQATFETDEHGQIVQINRRFEELAHTSLALTGGMGWVNLIHRDDRDQILTQWRHAIHDKRAWRESMRLRLLSGAVIQVVIDAHPMMDTLGTREVVGWFGTVEQVPEGSSS